MQCWLLRIMNLTLAVVSQGKVRPLDGYNQKSPFKVKNALGRNAVVSCDRQLILFFYRSHLVVFYYNTVIYSVNNTTYICNQY